MSLVQMGAGMRAQEAGFLTLGYAVVLVAFIRAGEKLLQKFGPRKPMLWGSVVVAFSILLLMQTYLMADTYKVLAFVAFSLFGLGLAFHATPSTDAALSSLHRFCRQTRQRRHPGSRPCGAWTQFSPGDRKSGDDRKDDSETLHRKGWGLDG